jgi:hypothetical protein
MVEMSLEKIRHRIKTKIKLISVNNIYQVSSIHGFASVINSTNSDNSFYKFAAFINLCIQKQSVASTPRGPYFLGERL